MIADSIDSLTRAWIRDESDERAAHNGCWFDEKIGQFVVDWMADFLRLYEGEYAGQPFECRDWQYDFVMRLFGWQKDSERWGRTVRRFSKASIWVPKKNKKSPTLAAVGLYLLCGDGEMGQKVFFCAKDGTQAREIAGKHAIEMCQSSDRLMSECSINRSKMQITHEPTRSILLPLSSDDSRSQKAKEGLNGSVLVDETHVVDADFMARMSRAGISRSEPIQLEVSTAGNEPESYGHWQYEYGKSVAEGRKEDQSLLFICHEAPQELTDAELHANPVKYGKLANPSWGHTVHEEEFLEDYNRSKSSLSRLAEFKMYRLNVWQQSANPWLSVHDWNACPGTDGELPDDCPTFAGLDLSRTTDLTAWLLYQPDEYLPRCYGHYWLPQERVVSLSEQFEIPIREWIDAGWITVCPGRRIDYGMVHARLKADAQRFKHLSFVGFDPYNSGPTVNFCQDELGLEMVELRQGVQTLSAPSKALEAMVVGEAIDHRCDPVLAWMIGNVAIKTDENGNIKPVKTVGGVRKHIDGVVALVMAIAVAMGNPDAGPSIYSQPGNLAL